MYGFTVSPCTWEAPRSFCIVCIFRGKVTRSKCHLPRVFCKIIRTSIVIGSALANLPPSPRQEHILIITQRPFSIIFLLLVSLFPPHMQHPQGRFKENSVNTDYIDWIVVWLIRFTYPSSSISCYLDTWYSGFKLHVTWLIEKFASLLLLSCCLISSVITESVLTAYNLVIFLFWLSFEFRKIMCSAFCIVNYIMTLTFSSQADTTTSWFVIVRFKLLFSCESERKLQKMSRRREPRCLSWRIGCQLCVEKASPWEWEAAGESQQTDKQIAANRV